MEAIFEEMAKNKVKLTPAQSYPTLIELEHSNWRSEFPLESRQWICNQIASLLSRIYTNSFIVAVIPIIAYEFEAQIFEEMAKSEVDYLRKILFKLFSFFGDFEPICLSKDDQIASTSSFQSETTPDATTNDSIEGNELMTQYSNCIEVPLDFHQNPATSLHNGQDDHNPLPENTIICTGNHNQCLDWKEQTVQEINYLVMTYGKRFRDTCCWVNEGPKKKGRSLIKMDRIPRWKDELDSILNILVTGKESVSLELKEKIPFIEKRILYYINMKELFDCSQEIFSKLDTLNPDEVQKFLLDQFIKAFLMEKAKKLGVHIHLVEDDCAGYTITYALSREITEIINEWCDHKIRILTQRRPTMEDIEKELSIWQTPGSKLQQWCLLKHLPMKVGPVRQHPDLLFEEVCSIWELHDKIEQKQASLLQWHQRQLVGPARNPTSPVARPVDPTAEELDAIQQKARPLQQMGPALEQLQTYHGFSRKAVPTLLQFGSVSELLFPLPEPMGSALQQLQRYQGFSRNRLCPKQASPVPPRLGSVPELPAPKPQQMGPLELLQQYYGFTKQPGPTPPRFGSVSELPAPKPQQTDHALQQLQQHHSFSKQAGPTPPQFGSVSELPRSKPQQMDPTHQLTQKYVGLTSQHTEAGPKQPDLSHLCFMPEEPVPVPTQQYTDTASPTEPSEVGVPRIIPAAA